MLLHPSTLVLKSAFYYEIVALKGGTSLALFPTPPLAKWDVSDMTLVRKNHRVAVFKQTPKI